MAPLCLQSLIRAVFIAIAPVAINAGPDSAARKLDIRSTRHAEFTLVCRQRLCS